MAIRVKPEWNKPAKSANKLIERIEDLYSKPDRWLQGELSNYEQTKFCILGALDYVRDGTNIEIECDTRTKIVKAAKKVFPLAKIFTVSHFNDATAKSIDDVRKVLRAAKRIKVGS